MHPARTKVGKPGKIAANKIGVYDHGPDGALRLRGQVGVLATQSTAARFHGKLGSTLGKVAGRPAWIAPDRNITSAFGSAQKVKLAKQLMTARGSVSSKR